MDKTPTPKSKYRPDQSQPKIPHIFLSRQKNKNLNKSIIQLIPMNGQSYQSQQFIIDAKKYTQKSQIQHSSSKRQLKYSQGIRAQIDICLNAVKNVYQQKKRKKNIINNIQISQKQFNNSIHRVDSQIILEYIHTIEKQYEINNYFQENDQILAKIQSKMDKVSMKNPQSRYLSHINNKKQENIYNSNIKRGKNSSKTFISLTLSQGRPKRSISTTKDKNVASQKRKQLNKYPSTANFQVNNQNDIKNNINSGNNNKDNNQMKNHQQSKDIRISNEYKYCILCQQKVLVSNIDYHQQYECPQLKQLYKADYNTLKQFIHNKIVKIKGQLLLNVSSFQINTQKIKKNNQLQQNFLDELHLFIKSFQNIQTGQVQQQQTNNHYNQLLYLHNNMTLSVDLLAQAQKLHWFVNIYCQLCLHESQEKCNIKNIVNNQAIRYGFHKNDNEDMNKQLKDIQQFSQKQS